MGTWPQDGQLALYINGRPFDLEAGTLSAVEVLGERGEATFEVNDPTGLQRFQEGNHVRIVSLNPVITDAWITDLGPVGGSPTGWIESTPVLPITGEEPVEYRIDLTLGDGPVVSRINLFNQYRPWETGQPLTYSGAFRAP